jgi:succinate dehydrogenase / fumarate reductase iron-sulfur subunit
MPEVVLRVARSPRNGEAAGRVESMAVDVDPGRDSVLDLIERAWATVDPTLVFRHACHHASCGTCAVRVDGHEVLPCITPVADVWDGESPLRLEPLRNLPVIADLAVDPAGMLERMAEIRFPYVRTVESEVRACATAGPDADVGAAARFEDCLECLSCVSACPVAGGDPDYIGPAVLAAADRIAEVAWARAAAGDDGPDPHVERVLDLVGGDHGVWQCRSVFACSAVCPSGVDPAARIMDLRRRLIRRPGGARRGDVAVAGPA